MQGRGQSAYAQSSLLTGKSSIAYLLSALALLRPPSATLRVFVRPLNMTKQVTMPEHSAFEFFPD